MFGGLIRDEKGIKDGSSPNSDIILLLNIISQRHQTSKLFPNFNHGFSHCSFYPEGAN
jgi:hypothetical protein